MPKYTSTYTGAQIDGAIEDVIKTRLGEYDGVCQVIKITDPATTLADVLTELIAVNTAGDYVFFDTSALNANAYMCTISFDDFSNPSTYKITELVTSQIGNGFYGENVTLLSCLLNLVPIGEDTTVYGVRWDKTTTQLTRYGKGAGITTTTTNFKNSGSENDNYDNPFDSIYPWSGRKLCNIDVPTYMALSEGDDITDCVTAWEGDSGFSYNDPWGVWVYTPEFWGRAYDDGDYRYYEVSPNEQNGFFHYPASIEGKWQACSVSSKTISGESKDCLLPTIGVPTTGSKTLAQLHTCAKNFGATLQNRWTFDADVILYLVEFANWNSQATLGNGVDDLYDETVTQTVSSIGDDYIVASASHVDYVAHAVAVVGSVTKEITSVDGTKLYMDVTGISENDAIKIHGLANFDDGMGSKSGYIGTNGKSHAYYRGKELYGNMFTYILGIYRDGSTDHVWVASTPEEADSYDELNASVHIDTGIVLAPAGGYVKKLGISSARNLFCVPCCTETGGSSSAPVGDYFYTDTTTAKRIFAVGGRANNGATDGIGYADVRVNSGTATWTYGSRPNLLVP